MAARGRPAAGTGDPVTATLVFVGGGPRTVSLLERIAASATLLGADEVVVHVVDPHPAGGGRIWRRAQSPLLWMNSTTEDVTLFTDDSVRCDGPIVPGPTLYEWASALQVRPPLERNDFASREVQSGYLRWVLDGAVQALPDSWRVVEHRQSAVDVLDRDDGAQVVLLADGDELVADVVVLAQGYLERRPTAAERSLLDAAATAGLRYVPPAFTADLDLSGIPAGEPVLVRGFGLAFVDLMVLLGEGRGGRFVDDGTRYLPSGAEPVIWVGSRRGVPYHAKLGYRRPTGPVATRSLTTALIRSGSGVLDFRTVLLPLIARDLTHAHYRELFAAHPERTRGGWASFESALDAGDLSGVPAAVPDPADRFDLGLIDRPFDGAVFRDRTAWEDVLADHVRADLRRRADPAHSADSAVFDMLLAVYGMLVEALLRGRISAQDRVEHVEGSFLGLFSFLASGPPPRRLQQLLALHEAGVVRFLGPDIDIDLCDGSFVASSPAVPGTVHARTLIDAHLPRPDVRAATDPVVRGLFGRGRLAAEQLFTADGSPLPGGQLLADADCRAIAADGSAHPRRFLLGPSVSGSAGSAGFARPGHNSPGLRQNDHVARLLLGLLADRAPAVAGAVPSPRVKEYR
jgi:hypothetical protein